METKAIDFIKSLPNNDETTKQFLEFFEMEDAQFDAVYSLLKEKLEVLLKGKAFQEQLISQIKLISPEEREDVSRGYKDLLDTIERDTSLSKNKKEMLRTIFKSTAELYNDLKETERERIEVAVYRNNSDVLLPRYSHPTDAGADVYANEEVQINAGETRIVKTGLFVAIPSGYEIQIRPRSGLSAKTGLRIANSPGTIDSSFRGEIGIIITNIGREDYTVKKNERIAQMVIAPVPKIFWKEVGNKEDLSVTDRGENGFGSTGS